MMIFNAANFTKAKYGSVFVFSTEISDLELKRRPSHFLLESPKTGKHVQFVYSHAQYASKHDNEVASWHYKITDLSVERHPNLKNAQVTIFND